LKWGERGQKKKKRKGAEKNPLKPNTLIIKEKETSGHRGQKSELSVVMKEEKSGNG